MKKFLQLFAITLITVEVFLFFGGYRLFDFSRSYYGAGAACAFVVALLLYGFLVQSDKLEALEQRIQTLENHETDNKEKES